MVIRFKSNNYKSFTSFIQNYAVLVYIKSCNITLAQLVCEASHLGANKMKII
jgi:hypothetical protein